MWQKFSELAVRYENFHLEKFVTFGRIKSIISKHHVGLVYLPSDSEKIKATFGMKPFEYAYANVQPASVGSKLIDLESKKEFGYECSPKTIESEFKNNLVNFKKEENLMDNHVFELFVELSTI